MNTFDWDDSYDVHVEEFNVQHQGLIKILNDLYAAMEDKSDKIALANVLNNLIKYAQIHFATEEKYMDKFHYPDYQLHLQEHENFRKKISEFCKNFKDEKIVMYFEIAVFIKNWIFNHILEVDKKYGEFFNKNGLI